MGKKWNCEENIMSDEKITIGKLRKFGLFLYALRENDYIPVERCPSDMRPGWQQPFVDDKHPLYSDEVTKATWGYYDLLYASGLVGVGGAWSTI